MTSFKPPPGLKLRKPAGRADAQASHFERSDKAAGFVGGRLLKMSMSLS
jgi:hypothetical protein